MPRRSPGRGHASSSASSTVAMPARPLAAREQGTRTHQQDPEPDGQDTEGRRATDPVPQSVEDGSEDDSTGGIRAHHQGQGAAPPARARGGHPDRGRIAQTRRQTQQGAEPDHHRGHGLRHGGHPQTGDHPACNEERQRPWRDPIGHPATGEDPDGEGRQPDGIGETEWAGRDFDLLGEAVAEGAPHEQRADREVEQHRPRDRAPPRSTHWPDLPSPSRVDTSTGHHCVPDRPCLGSSSVTDVVAVREG